MAQKITRRGWAAAITATAALSPSLNQAQVPVAQETPEELLEEARRQARRNQETLAKVPLEMAVEPASRFEA